MKTPIATRRDGLEFNIAYIPEEFTDTVEEQSGLEYMARLYELGYAMAKQGYPWESAPLEVDTK